mgnify:CR=1 FL=1
MITRAHILAGIGLFLLGCLVGREWRDRSADLAESRNQSEQYLGMVKAEQQARATEHQQAETLATIGAKHEEDREAAEAVPAAVVADLRAGNLQLRRQWAACETNRVSESAAGIAERDALAELRAKDQGDLVRIGRDADDQVKACQATVNVDRSVREE